MTKGVVSNIKRFAVHDGGGIRTTVFLKGCSLKCVWCHNPEGISFKPQLAYYEHKCVHCGVCADVCPAGAHKMTENGHVFDREKCIGCGKCAEKCLGSALTFYGTEMTVEELLPKLLEDKDFFETSGGGVTLSGGECLCQAEFCEALLKALNEKGVHTAVDTCGFVPQATLDSIMQYTDVFLYDIKAIDKGVHIACTGQENSLILENIKYLNSCGKYIEVRIPYVPDFNDNEIDKIVDFLKPLENVRAVRVLAYHNFAGSKYKALGMKNTLPERLPTNEEIENAQKKFS